jgi:hypothetical protein
MMTKTMRMRMQDKNEEAVNDEDERDDESYV